jgi:hypothetical protein
LPSAEVGRSWSPTSIAHVSSRTPELGSVDALKRSGAAALLAVPLAASDEVLGVFTLHRRTSGLWSGADVSVAEAVAREAALALHVAQLLAENEQRLRHQTALLRAAQQVTSELELETVLQRLVDEVATLLEVEAADLYLYDLRVGVLRCAAVHGMPSELVGFEFSAERGVAAEAIRRNAPVISADYERLDEPVPHPAYEGFAERSSCRCAGPARRAACSAQARAAASGVSRKRMRTCSARSRPSPRWRCETRSSTRSARDRRASSAASTGSPRSSARRCRWPRRSTRWRRPPRMLSARTPSACSCHSAATSSSWWAAHGLPPKLMGVLRTGLPESASVLRLCAGERR